MSLTRDHPGLMNKYIEQQGAQRLSLPGRGVISRQRVVSGSGSCLLPCGDGGGSGDGEEEGKEGPRTYSYILKCAVLRR